MKYYFIVNKESRSGKGGVIWSIIEPKLQAMDIQMEVFFTERRGHASKLVQAVNELGAECVIVVIGGDGTFNEVMNGISNFDQVSLGYIPAGSGNDLARSLGLVRDPFKALEVVMHPKKIQMLDIGVVTRLGKSRRFVVSTGLGFDAAVCHQSAVSKMKHLLNKLRIGKLTYVGIALGRLFHDPPVTMEVCIDDEAPRVFEKTYFVTAMNMPYEGGGFKFCPEAKFDDGKLDVIVVSGMSKLRVLRILPTAFSGKHVGFSGVDVFRCEKVVFRAEKPMMLHVDGEALFLRRQVEVDVLPGRVRMIMG
ncbi:MAG: diacylglycerol kinase family lipid kinase [Lachnospiraceae bacterium]|nr:diacylglycerol kinase family lipid kinase [Lachnospiraceae bacterium]